MLPLLALLPLVPLQRIPKAPRLARAEHVQVWASADDANQHPGRIVGLLFEPGSVLELREVTEPAGLVIEGRGRAVRKMHLGSDTSSVYAYDLTLLNEPHSYAAVSCTGTPPSPGWADPEPNGDTPGLSAFVDCYFGGGEVSWNVADVEGVPGITDGKTACKWWVNGKAPRRWLFEGCVFEASQEHALYLHWWHDARIESCQFWPTGGADIQAVWRYGRPGTGAYYGNSGVSPPRSGDFVVLDCRFSDLDIWSREASTITVVSAPQGNVYIKGVWIRGARGAIALWSDDYKGTYSSSEYGRHAFISSVEGFGDVQVDPGGGIRVIESPEDLLGRPFNTVVVADVHIEDAGNHDREQIMASGFKEGVFSNIYVESNRPKLVIGAEGGGAWRMHRVDVTLRGDYPAPMFWDGEQYQTATPENRPGWFGR